MRALGGSCELVSTFQEAAVTEIRANQGLLQCLLNAKLNWGGPDYMTTLYANIHAVSEKVVRCKAITCL